MDRNTALSALIDLRQIKIEQGMVNIAEAIGVAIEALKGDLHCPKCGTIVRDGRQYHDLVYGGEAEKHQLSGETSTISEETSTNDCIRRQDVLNLAKDGKIVSNTNYKKVVAHINNIPSANATDCISRKQAIEEIKNAFTITGWNKYASQEEIVDDVERQLRRLFVGAIESLPPVTPTERTGEWIPVSERLPEDKEDVLVYLSSARIAIASYRRDKLPFMNTVKGWGYRPLYGHIDFGKENVIAWMPLPEPYKGGDTE